jgi:glycosyltransferase involved in cell wall biosynthesis
MRIAYIVPYVPNRIRTRPYNLIRYLSRLGHEVDVFTVGSSDRDFDDAQELRSKCRQVYYYHLPLWRSLVNSLIAVPSDRPLQSVYSWHRGLADHLNGIFSGNNNLPNYDVVHVEHLRGSEYGVYLKSKFPGLRVVWDSVDCISHLFEQASGRSRSFFGRFVTRFELRRTRLAEGRLLGRFDHVLSTSSMDREALLALAPDGMKSAPISVLSNGVDQDYFQPNNNIQRDPETLVFSGKMSYHANISMVMYLAREVMPRIWQKRPGVRLVVVGKDPSAAVRKLSYNPLIVVTGTVDDIRYYLWKATVAVVPLVYGTGIQNKILEAMATGTPVITTSNALRSLGAVPGREIMIADSPEEFSEGVLRLIENRRAQRELGEAGCRYIQKNHSWNDVARNLADIYLRSGSVTAL